MQLGLQRGPGTKLDDPEVSLPHPAGPAGVVSSSQPEVPLGAQGDTLLMNAGPVSSPQLIQYLTAVRPPLPAP